MNKLHKWFGVATALLLAPTVQAQPDNFYQFVGNFDHGIGREVIQSIDPFNPGYIIAGTANVVSPNNQPGVMVSAYNPAGMPVWSNIYPINNGMPSANTTADAVSIAANPGMNIYGVLAYTDFSNPAQSVLFQVGLNGVPTGIQTPLGDLRATSVIYDPGINCFAVLGQSPINNTDLQLIVVDMAGVIIFSESYDSGPGFRDTPARLMQDPHTNNYVLVGTSEDPVTFDRNVFVVRVDPSFTLFCSETIGLPGVDEIGVDVTWGKNAAGNAVNVVLGYVRGSSATPVVIELDPFICPGYLSSTLLNAFQTPLNIPTGITVDPNNYDYSISGLNYDYSVGNTNGFIAVINAAYAPINYARYGQPWLPGNEDFTDILFDPAGFIVTTGQHEMLNPLPPSPPNQYYPWLVLTNTIGMGQCPDVPPMTTVPVCLQTIVWNIRNPFLNFVPLNLFWFPVGCNPYNECLNPFRMDGSAQDEVPGAKGAMVFPNPASGDVSVMYTVDVADKPVLEVTNMLGEVVLTQSLTPTEKNARVDVSALAPGVYFFRILNGDVELANEKVTIQR